MWLCPFATWHELLLETIAFAAFLPSVWRRLHFRSTIGNYPLEALPYNGGKKRTVAFWDQSYGTLAKTTGMSCRSLKSVARRVGASPIVFTDVMPTPAVYSPGSDVPREAREDTDEQSEVRS
jgi:hypothetical protein